MKVSKRTRLATVLVAVGLALGSVAAAYPAQAATTCNPKSYHFDVTEASVAVVIGSLHVNTQACETSKSSLSSSSASLSFVASGLGGAAGWEFVDNHTSLSGSKGLQAGYVSTGAFKLCVPAKISPLCSNPEEFKVNETAYGYDFIGPIPLPNIACTSSNCKLHFKYKP